MTDHPPEDTTRADRGHMLEKGLDLMIAHGAPLPMKCLVTGAAFAAEMARPDLNAVARVDGSLSASFTTTWQAQQDLDAIVRVAMRLGATESEIAELVEVGRTS